jgi:hypothetical protein
MEYVTPRNVTNGITAGKAVLCESPPIAMSYNNREILGSGAFCWVLPEVISRRPTWQRLEKYREYFNEPDAFTALRFTATGASPAATRMRILSKTQHAWRPITFGMNEVNELIDLYTVLCYTAGSADHAWEFLYFVSSAQ